MLDRTVEHTATGTEFPVDNQVESQASVAGLDEAQARVGSTGGHWLARALQFFVAQSSSSLTRRIVVLNVTGLVALSISIIFLSQFRAGLIDAR
ncbi:MAG: sensor N-terminal transmembrane domain-containing protein, partial [Xanthobacteraceae bacterium]